MGKLAVPLPGYIESAEELAGIMRQAGIDQALVFHAESKEYHPAVGNRRLQDELRGFPNLHACWCVLPGQTKEMPPARELVEIMRQSGVRAARVYPNTHNWSLSEWSCGDLLSALEEQAVPLFIDFEEASCDALHSLCRNHPRLPVVLAGAPFRLSRMVYALLAGTSNLYIDTSQFQLHCGIEDLTLEFGAERLLFGTFTPHFSPGPSVMAVKYARISDEEKGMIAGGNLRRLLDSAFSPGVQRS